MNKLAQLYIKRVYEGKDYVYFKNKCKQVPLYLEELIELASSMCIKIDTYCTEDDPAVQIWFYFEGYTEDRFNAEYRTLLKISKVANLFVFQHEFGVENRDPNKMVPILDGFSEEAYVFSQNKLEATLTDFLENKNLVKLQLRELEEVVMNFEIPEEGIFGSQMTLENALFRDLYGICEI
ncbi:MAG: hypothetical protein HDR22_02090 [Lachnospiraceae bacterium]|nr:hypothetical protein [Lachnospiraceae bacterium]